MGFRTKIDFSNNRQVKQRQQTTSDLLGKNNIGLPFTGLTSGADYTSSAATSSYSDITSTFIGNLTATTFNYGLALMSAGTPYMNVITSTNYNDIQIVEPHFVGQNPHVNPHFNNTVYPYYTGVGFDFTVTDFVEYSPNQFSGTALSENVTVYTAGSFDYDGDGVWLNVNGKLKTEKIIISNNASTGKVLGCIDNSGTTAWINVSGSSNGNQYFTSGTTAQSLQSLNQSATANLPFSFAVGLVSLAGGNASFAANSLTQANGDYSVAVNLSSIVDGQFSFGGYNSMVDSDGAFGFGDSLVVKSDFAASLAGANNMISGSSMHSAIIGGTYNLLTGNSDKSVILGGSGITGSSPNMVYVPNINIKNLTTGTTISNLAIDNTGNVIKGNKITGGIASFTGDGVTNTFNIPHGLGGEPVSHVVSRNLDNNVYDYQSSANTTNIVVSFIGSTVTLADVVKLNWMAFTI